MMKKWTFIAASFVLLVGLSCSSPGGGKNTSTTKQISEAPKAVEKSTASSTIEESTNPADAANNLGQKLYSDKGCLVCHQLRTKLIGPSTKDIAAAYSGNKTGLTSFLKGKARAIVDPAQFTLMQPQITVTKELSNEELDAMVDYILSIK